AVTFSRSGALWIGTRNSTLCRWESGKLTTWTNKEGLSHHSITALYVSRAGDLWIGSTDLDHVQRFHDGQFETFSMPHNNGQVGAIAEDSNGVIWMGRTFRGGLFKIQNDQLIAKTPPGQYSPIHSLHVTSDNSLWIAFYGRGLGRMQNDHL